MSTVIGYLIAAAAVVTVLLRMEVSGGALVFAAVAVRVIFAALVTAHHAPHMLPALLEALGRLRP